MKVKIIFDCDNAAFEDDRVGEIRRIMDIATNKILVFRKLEAGTLNLMDSNGNTVGKVIVTEG